MAILCAGYSLSPLLHAGFVTRRRGSRPIRQRDKWRIRWTDHTGKRRSEVHDSEDDAWHALRKHELEAEDIRRGLRPRLRAPDKTFGDLFDRWIKVRVPRKRSGADDRSIIKAHLRPLLGRIRLRDFAVEQMDEVIEQWRMRCTVEWCKRKGRCRCTPKADATINNILTLLIANLNMAKELRWIAEVPKVRKVKGTRHEYAYLRTSGEIRRFLRASLEEGIQVHALYATAVYTGMRAGELAGLRWADIDLDRRLITVQRSYNGPTKSGKTRYVPIFNALLPVLREWRLRCPNDLVFPNRRGKVHGESAKIFQETLQRVLERGMFPKRKRRGRARHYIVFHDLRHTFASHYMMNGGDVFRLQKILGHSSISITMRYTHLAPDEIAIDLDRFASDLVWETTAGVRPLAVEE